MLEDFDKDISTLTESVVRRLSRRKIFSATVKGLSAAAIAATLGQISTVRQAFAVALDQCTCECDFCWTTGSPCSNCPSSGVSCPTGCTTCVSPDCGGWCNYSSGQWVAYQCTGLGEGNGYKMCIDCKCPDCNNKCTCLSGCICCNCVTPEDVKAEMKRLSVASVQGHSFEQGVKQHA